MTQDMFVLRRGEWVCRYKPSGSRCQIHAVRLTRFDVLGFVIVRSAGCVWCCGVHDESISIPCAVRNLSWRNVGAPSACGGFAYFVILSGAKNLAHLSFDDRRFFVVPRCGTPQNDTHRYPTACCGFSDPSKHRCPIRLWWVSYVFRGDRLRFGKHLSWRSLPKNS